MGKVFIGIILVVNLLVMNTDFDSNSETTIKVRVVGIQSIEGQMKIGLYTEDNNFPDVGDVDNNRLLKVDKSVLETTFTLKKDKKYAIAVHHDLNMDGLLNKNFFGKPTEPYGFSNNPSIWFRAPSFEECAFVPMEGAVIEIQI